MKQVTNIHAKKYVAPAVETFKMEQEAIMSASGATTTPYKKDITTRRRSQFDDDEE
jgi:hypothetical protein